METTIGRTSFPSLIRNLKKQSLSHEGNCSHVTKFMIPLSKNSTLQSMLFSQTSDDFNRKGNRILIVVVEHILQKRKAPDHMYPTPESQLKPLTGFSGRT